MSYSIIARCARTGEIGIAMVSPRLAGGAVLEAAILRGVGGILVQGPPNPRLNRLATHLLAQGWGPNFVLGELEANDPEFASRQVAIVDREMAVSTSTVDSGEVRKGTGYAVLTAGAGAAGVADAMVAAFEAQPLQDLDERLLSAIEAADAASAPAGHCSSAIVVWGILDYSTLDLRVDLDDRPVQELRRVFADFKPSAEFYEARARNPRMKMNAREFAGMLDAKRKQAQ